MAESATNFKVLAPVRSRLMPLSSKEITDLLTSILCGSKAGLGKATQRGDEGKDEVHSMGKTLKKNPGGVEHNREVT